MFPKNRALPPSLAQFSTCETGVVVYAGYSTNKTMQFYHLPTKSVTMTIPLTHWAMCMHLSGSLIATGVNGKIIIV